MKSVFALSKEEIAKRHKTWIWIFVVSLTAYLLAVFLLLAFERRENALFYLIPTYVLTILEGFFSLYYLLYKRKRIKRYERMVIFPKELFTVKLSFVQKDGVLLDELPFRHLVFRDADDGKELDFYAISSFDDAFAPNGNYVIKHHSGIIYEVSGDEMP